MALNSNDEFVTRNDKVVDVDAVLAEVGSFGKFQLMQYALIGLPVVLAAFLNSNYIFVAGDIDYRCTISQCDPSNTTLIRPSWLPEVVTDHRCSRPTVMPIYNESFYQNCSRKMFSNNITEKCNKWIYENQDSIVETFDMACKPWLRTIVGTTHNAGMMASMPLLGYVSDKYGRKTALIVSAVGGGCLGVLKTFAINYGTYLTFEFLEATLGAATYTSAFVLMVELGGKEKRVLSSTIIGFCITFGEIVFALIAQAVPYWKILIRITYTPAVLFITYTFILSESIRWLLINGKRKQAKNILIKAGKVNGNQISNEVLMALDKNDIDAGEQHSLEPFRIKDLFRSTIILRRLAVSSFWWLTAAFIYYGLMINSVELPGNKYVNFILTAAVSLPGDIIALFSLNTFGRKKTLMFGYLFCGSCCVISTFIPKKIWWLGLIVYLLGKMSITTCFNGLYIYSSELFPTTMRSSLMGCCSMFARVGSIVAPQTPLLVTIMPSLPSFLFGGFALTAGILMIFTPETLNLNLPDTVAEAENIGKKKAKAENLQGVYNSGFN